jgi:predicted lipoprotein with Yx(FWY)xxD motif
MVDSQHAATSPVEDSVRSRRRRDIAIRATALVAGAALSTGLAFAAKPATTVRAAHNSKLNETIVVDAHGNTLYALSPETTHHLLCNSSACLSTWPPLTVRSRNVKLKAAHGVSGRLAILRRSDGKLQVTLRGMPLYRFSGDSARGQANGEGIQAFGGTWHAATASASPQSTTMAPSSSTPTTTTTAPAYTAPTNTTPTNTMTTTTTPYPGLPY